MGREARRERPDAARKARRFGPSTAGIRVAPGQSGELILSVLRSVLGRPRATLRDAASLAGAPDGAIVTVAVVPMHGRRIIEVHTRSGVVELRMILHRGHDGKVVIENDQIDVDAEFQRQGRGARLIGRQVEHALRLGVAEIRGYATRDDQIGDVGYLVWPVLGFDGDLPGAVRDRLPSGLAEVRRVGDLVRSAEGRIWWHENGVSIVVTLNLEPHSRSLRMFRTYLRRKGLP